MRNDWCKKNDNIIHVSFSMVREDKIFWSRKNIK